ncbi:ABC-type Fe3+-hydroxamate transport system, substrate-binding protein [Paenibacillus algorifonticola]|uniref:ABC-type Fe3+-hydroxamate transport system, substrate-binding protein n=1 Tax=Paenibacillus algorifonticola TaxID=684063 RepID=A0A1I2BWL8_9BACL|nr:AraC family transcriptional regulator [Paenibacillus algorifonticola]SFE60318.1 ABC-type Fe3+-hydroxamate transport system, substrate-binding protein [Paenibacillus algorifonticola]
MQNLANLMKRLIFTSVHCYSFRGQADDQLTPKMLHTYAIGYVTAGKGLLKMNGTATQVKPGDLFFLQPEMMVEGHSDSTDPIQYSLILFSCMQLSKPVEGWSVKRPIFPLQGKIALVEDRSSVEGLIQQLFELSQHFLVLERHTIHYVLSSLLLIIMGRNIPAKQQTVGMEHVLAYMNENYTKDLQVSQLAEMAGFSTNHFTKTFKNQMSITPSEYLLKQRIIKAKQLLVSSMKAKRVAEQVGYKDEHYFSRVFKKAEGVAPTLYIKNKCHRIAALYYGLDDHLITLGYKPVAALSYTERVSSTYTIPMLNEYSKESFMLQGGQTNYDKLLRTKPDLMLTSDRLEQDERLNQIAPTAVLKHSNKYGQTLEQLAGLLGREQQAAVWISRYGERKERLKERMKAHWGEQSVYFIRVSQNFYRVYGKRNQTGSLFYDDLGLSLPGGFPAHEWALDIQLNDLPLLNPQHIFLMADPTNGSKMRLQHLLQSEEWQALDAVRRHHVYDASDLFFKALGPSGRMWAMNYAAFKLGITE